MSGQRDISLIPITKKPEIPPIVEMTVQSVLINLKIFITYSSAIKLTASVIPLFYIL